MISIIHHQPLFLAYLGLTASGYDMADPKDVALQSLIAAIRHQGWPPSALAYFRLARSDRVAVNPYWPRGSCLAAASFFLDPTSLHFTDFQAYLRFEQEAGASDSGSDPEFVAWMEKLPDHLQALRQHDAFPPLWQAYLGYLHDREPLYRQQLTAAERCLTRLYPAETKRPNLQIIYAPNPLQSPMIADFVHRERRLYVISAQPRSISILHEYLHPLVQDLAPVFLPLLEGIETEQFADSARMKEYGYAWDDSELSRQRIAEESIVRALSRSLLDYGDEAELLQAAQNDAQSGFRIVPALALILYREKPTAEELPRILPSALKTSLSESRSG